MSTTSAAVAVPLDTAYKAAQVRTVLTDAGARVLFTTERYLDTDEKRAVFNVLHGHIGERQRIAGCIVDPRDGLGRCKDLAAGDGTGDNPFNQAEAS